MWQIKLLGGSLLLCVGTMLGLWRVKLEKQKLSVLDGWLALLHYIRGQIDCYLMPLDEILANADRDLLAWCMARDGEITLPALLDSSAPYLSEESKKLLEGMIREMGASYREEQLKRCDFYIDALQKIREKNAAELPMRQKMSMTIAFCASLGCAILLW